MDQLSTMRPLLSIHNIFFVLSMTLTCKSDHAYNTCDTDLLYFHAYFIKSVTATTSPGPIHYNVWVQLGLLIFSLSIPVRLCSYLLLPTSPPTAAIWFDEMMLLLHNIFSIYYSTQLMFLFFCTLISQSVASIHLRMSVTLTAPYQVCLPVMP